MKNAVWLMAATVLLFSLSNFSNASEIRPATNMAGDLKLTIDSINFIDAPSDGPTSQFTLGSFRLDITNTGTDKVRIALMGKINLQMKNGTRFNVDDVSGLTRCSSDNVKICQGMADDFEVIDPKQTLSVICGTQHRHKQSFNLANYGSISGILFVQNQTTHKSFKRTVSLTDISIEASN